MKQFLQFVPLALACASFIALGSVGLYRIGEMEASVDKLASEVEKQTLAVNALSMTLATHLAVDRLSAKGGSPMPPPK